MNELLPIAVFDGDRTEPWCFNIVVGQTWDFPIDVSCANPAGYGVVQLEQTAAPSGLLVEQDAVFPPTLSVTGKIIYADRRTGLVIDTGSVVVRHYELEKWERWMQAGTQVRVSAALGMRDYVGNPNWDHRELHALPPFVHRWKIHRILEGGPTKPIAEWREVQSSGPDESLSPWRVLYCSLAETGVWSWPT